MGRIRVIIVVHTGTIVDEMSGKSGLRNGAVGRIADAGRTIRVVANLGLLRHGVDDVMNERRREKKGKGEFHTKTWAKNSDLFPCASGFDGIKSKRN